MLLSQESTTISNDGRGGGFVDGSISEVCFEILYTEQDRFQSSNDATSWLEMFGFDRVLGHVPGTMSKAVATKNLVYFGCFDP